MDRDGAISYLFISADHSGNAKPEHRKAIRSRCMIRKNLKEAKHLFLPMSGKLE